MDHKYIEDFDFVDRYLTGRLTADETAQFEEHFVGCTRCSEELWTTEDFIEGFRREQNYQTLMHKSGALGRWVPPLIVLPRWLSLATAFLLIVTIAGAVIFLNRTRQSRIETDQVKSELSQREQRLEDERHAAALAESKHKETERELTAQLAQLQAELQNERKQESARSANQRDASKRPGVNLAILTLRAARASEASSGSINELTLSPTTSSFVLSIALEGKPAYRDYRITILNDQNRLVSKARGLTPDRYNSLSAEFDSTTFSNGGYLLKLEGVSADGRANVVGDYSFRIRRSSAR